MSRPARTGWPAVASCFALALFSWSFGFYGQAVFLAGLQRQNGWPASLIAAATTTYYLVGAVFMAFVPEWIGRVGPRPAVLAGVGLLAAGAASLPHVGTIASLFAAHVVMAGGWALTSSTAVTTVLAPWFGRRRGLAISVALNGASVAGFTVVPVMIKAVDLAGFAAGVGGTVLVVAGLVATLVIVLMRRPDEGWLAAERVPSPDRSSAVSEAARPAPATRRAAFASPRFWLLALPFGLALVAQVGFLVHQVAFLLPRLGADRTGIAVALTTVAALVGRLLVGALADRFDRRMMATAGFALQALSLGAILLVPAEPVLLLASFTFGLAVGNAITLPALLVLDEFAPASFGLMLGLVAASNQFLYAFGPVLLGLLHDATGGYGVPFAACMALEGAAAILALAGRRRGRRKQ